MTEPKEGKDPYLVLLDQQIKALSVLSEVDLGCRIGATGHRWHQVQPDRKPNVKGVVAMAKQCEACTTVVRYTVSERYGEYLSKPVYDYPDDYMIPSPTPGQRIRSQSVRAAWARRMKNSVLPPIMSHPIINE